MECCLSSVSQALSEAGLSLKDEISTNSDYFLPNRRKFIKQIDTLSSDDIENDPRTIAKHLRNRSISIRPQLVYKV